MNSLRRDVKELKLKRSHNRMFVFDDQLRLNYALQVMDPIWEHLSREKTATHDILRRATTASGFTVTLLSEDVVCRNNCSEELRSQYYVWHTNTHEKASGNKTLNFKRAQLWFLQTDWENCDSSALGEEWLKEISNLT